VKRYGVLGQTILELWRTAATARNSLSARGGHFTRLAKSWPGSASAPAERAACLAASKSDHMRAGLDLEPE
jgi:hypothetical protein